jgi:hypothetical protein
VKRALVVASTLAVIACASTGRAERIAKLSPESSTLFARYKQFMTERQQDQFLEAQTDLERKQQVDGLKIDDMLSQFPKPVQDAIWAQQVQLGMSRAAVLLSWGGPSQREFDEDQLSKGNEIERWYYRRNDRNAYVTFTNGIVSDYDDGSR